MTWKSTAVVSGAGLLATWLASYPPANAPAPAAVVPQAAAPTTGSDIAEAADRLQARVRSVIDYREPTRNPFRFEARVAAPASSAPTQVTAQVAPAPIVPTGPSIRLSGMAMDVIDGREQRTAILNAPQGLVFVKEGDEVAGYRIAAIYEDSVELVASDGSTITVR